MFNTGIITICVIICFERFKISWHKKSHPEENQFTNSIFVVIRTHYIVYTYKGPAKCLT